MSAETRGISKYLVELCTRYPQVALIFLPLAGFIVYNGLSDARLAQGTKGHSSIGFHVEQVYNEVERTIFPDYRAAGRVVSTRESKSIPISKNEFRKIKPGDKLHIVATGIEQRPFVTTRYAERQLSFVRFVVGGVPFNDAALFGIIGGLVALGWALFGKQISARLSKSKPPETAEKEAPKTE
jgi:hypothetical protein